VIEAGFDGPGGPAAKAAADAGHNGPALWGVDFKVRNIDLGFSRAGERCDGFNGEPVFDEEGRRPRQG
jgi:hypothetical protein